VSLLQNAKPKQIYFDFEAKKRETGGHFWHDVVKQNSTVTPAA